MKHYRDTLHGIAKKHKFVIIFTFFMIWFLLGPFIERLPYINIFFAYAYVIFVIITLFVISPNTPLFVFCSILLILSIILPLFIIYTNSLFIKYSSLIVDLTFNIIFTINIIWYTSSKKAFTKDDIFAGVLAFMLLGACYAEIYYSLCCFDPKVVHFASLNVNTAQSTYKQMELDLNKFMYFSFATLSTVGYGDIYPISGIARRICSIEGCTGILYLAIFIGRMITFYEEPFFKKKTPPKFPEFEEDIRSSNL